MTTDGRTPRIRYDEGCLAAHALNVVGDRWALLIVREMLLGRIPLDRLNRLKSMTEGEEAQKALAIYEGLEAVLSRSIE